MSESEDDYAGWGSESDASDNGWGSDVGEAHDACLGDSGLPYEATSHEIVWGSLLRRAQEAQDFCGLTDIGQAIELLRGVHWDPQNLSKALSSGSGIDGLLETVGISRMQQYPDPDAQCRICFTHPATYALHCGHGFCGECWEEYLRTTLDEGRMASIRCPASVTGCGLVVTTELVAAAAPVILPRYEKAVGDSFILSSPNLVYCPRMTCNALIYVSNVFDRTVCCTQCNHQFCRQCVKEYRDDTPTLHNPASCQVAQTWKQRLRRMTVDPRNRWVLFRAKHCPGCNAFTLKCGCMEKKGVIECEGMDYCPNHACNHMVCSQCSYQYCWVCLKNWDRHASFWECNEAVSASDGITARFKVCYQKYLNHLNGLEAADAMKADWLRLANSCCTAAPNTHFIYKKMQELYKFEETLLFCFAALFYLQRDRFEAWRAELAPLEQFVEGLKEELEGADLCAMASMSVADQSEEATKAYFDIQAIEFKLNSVKDTKFKDNELIPDDEVDNPCHEEVVANPQSVGAPEIDYSNALCCPFCHKKEYPEVKDLVHHVLAFHLGDQGNPRCPVCNKQGGGNGTFVQHLLEEHP